MRLLSKLLTPKVAPPEPIAKPKVNTEKIRSYVDSNSQHNLPIKVIFGGHWSNHDGWLVLDENDQDITQALHFEDNSVDFVFTEHVLEHIEFEDGISFLKECHRILKPGGTIRTVCPTIDALIRYSQKNWSESDFQNYTESCLKQYFVNPSKTAERELGINPLQVDPVPFYLHSLMKLHDHRFIWSEKLITNTLQAAGFKKIQTQNIGEGNPEVAIERRARGIYHGNNWQEDRDLNKVFDIESSAIEAVKNG